MKKSLKTLIALSTVGLALGAAVATGANGRAEEAKAETYTGSIMIQKDDNDAKWDGCNIVGYLFDGSNNSWGTVVTNTSNKYQEYSWSLSFEPTTIIMLRVPTNWSSSWDNPWWDGQGGIYARTGNVTLSNHDVIWMKGNAKEGSDWGAYSYSDLGISILGASTDGWSSGSETINEAFTNHKFSTDMNHLELYGIVEIPAQSYFKAHKGADDSWHNDYSAEESIQSHFSISAGTNIYDSVGGTYEIFYKQDPGSDPTLWITDPVSAAADEWAQAFHVNDQSCGTTKTNWASSRDSFNALKEQYGNAFVNIFMAVEHVDHEETAKGYLSLAMQRYDYVLERFGIGSANTDEGGYQDFIGRAALDSVTPKQSMPFGIATVETTASPTGIILLIVAGMIVLAGGYFLVRRARKED